MTRPLLLAVLALSLVACKRNSETPVPLGKPEAQSPVTIIYDRIWSIASATNSATMQCTAQTLGVCENARNQENEFYKRFSAAFQSDPACSGLMLFALDNPEGNPASAWQKLGKVADKDQWLLNVSFEPDFKKQPWSLQRMLMGSQVSGEGDAHLMAHTICSIVKRTGGSVVE
jgi:hypothetical protein